MHERIRLDKWLWAARFFKTRSLASAAIDAGKVLVNGERAKPAKEVHCADRLAVRTPAGQFDLVVKALSDQRGNAAAAQLLYEELEASRAARIEEAARRKRFADPTENLFARPTKKDRRSLERLRSG